jgi:hypothetical protein
MKRINHLAVIVAVILHQAIGYFWYSPAPWAVARLTALGRPASDVNAVDPAALVVDIIGWLIASYVIAWLIARTGFTTAAKGAMLGALLWLGIAMPTLLPHYLFAGIKPVVTVIDAANVLVACLLTGAIVGGWRRKER